MLRRSPLAALLVASALVAACSGKEKAADPQGEDEPSIAGSGGTSATGTGTGTGTGGATGTAFEGAEASDPALSDEFDAAGTLDDWLTVDAVEQWGASQLETYDVGATRDGWLTMVPHSNAWYGDYRGILSHKLVTGDFMVTTRLAVTSRAGAGAPRSLYSLAGIMVRAPRAVTPATWTRGGENYIFLAIGAADQPGTWQTEVKTTAVSNSVLAIGPGQGGEALLRTVRIGEHVLVMIRWPGGAWQIHRRYHRPDFPETLQVGMTTYTDWSTVEAMTPEQHNVANVSGGNPDVVAQFDYVRFAAPAIPAELQGRAWSNAAAVDDALALSFLGVD